MPISQSVNQHAVSVADAHEDVAYAAVLNPHEAVAHGVQAEDEEHDPSALVQLGFHPGRVFSNTGVSCAVTQIVHTSSI